MKKILVVAAAFALTGMVQASELWWTVNSVPTEVGDWTTAKLFANQTGYNYGGTEVGSVSKTDLENFGDTFTDLDKYGNSAYSFYVELFYGDTTTGYTTTGYKTYVQTANPPKGAASYDSLSGSVLGDPFDYNTKSVYTGFSQFTTSNVVPEPTSGLLVALGMMLFGLKRKRA